MECASPLALYAREDWRRDRRHLTTLKVLWHSADAKKRRRRHSAEVQRAGHESIRPNEVIHYGLPLSCVRRGLDLVIVSRRSLPRQLHFLSARLRHLGNPKRIIFRNLLTH